MIDNNTFSPHYADYILKIEPSKTKTTSPDKKQSMQQDLVRELSGTVSVKQVDETCDSVTKHIHLLFDDAIHSSRKEIWCWYHYYLEFENRVNALMRQKRVANKTARSIVYAELSHHFSGITQGHLQVKTHRARKIFVLFSAVGTDKIEQVSCSANKISRLTNYQIQHIITQSIASKSYSHDDTDVDLREQDSYDDRANYIYEHSGIQSDVSSLDIRSSENNSDFADCESFNDVIIAHESLLSGSVPTKTEDDMQAPKPIPASSVEERNTMTENTMCGLSDCDIQEGLENFHVLSKYDLNFEKHLVDECQPIFAYAYEENITMDSTGVNECKEFSCEKTTESLTNDDDEVVKPESGLGVLRTDAFYKHFYRDMYHFYNYHGSPNDFTWGNIIREIQQLANTLNSSVPLSTSQNELLRVVQHYRSIVLEKDVLSLGEYPTLNDIVLLMHDKIQQ